MIEFDRPAKKNIHISLVPLIDVGFFLLIFFLLAGNIQKFEIIPVEVPYADSGRLIDEGQVVIVLGRYDEMLVDDDLVMPGEFETVLKEKLKKNPDRIITLKSDSRLEATKMIAIMDRIKAAGGRNVSLVTQSLE